MTEPYDTKYIPVSYPLHKGVFVSKDLVDSVEGEVKEFLTFLDKLARDTYPWDEYD